MCIYIYIYVYIYMSVYIYICIHLFTPCCKRKESFARPTHWSKCKSLSSDEMAWSTAFAKESIIR